MVRRSPCFLMVLNTVCSSVSERNKNTTKSLHSHFSCMVHESRVVYDLELVGVRAFTV